MTSITVGFPPRELNPNRSHGVHWGKLNKIKARYKLEVWGQAKADKLTAPDTDRIILRLEFYPPSTHRKKADDDNLVAAFKAGRDGLAEALGVNDQLFKTDPILHPAGQAGKHGKLIISLLPG